MVKKLNGLSLLKNEENTDYWLGFGKDFGDKVFEDGRKSKRFELINGKS